MEGQRWHWRVWGRCGGREGSPQGVSAGLERERGFGGIRRISVPGQGVAEVDKGKGRRSYKDTSSIVDALEGILRVLFTATPSLKLPRRFADLVSEEHRETYMSLMARRLGKHVSSTGLDANQGKRSSSGTTKSVGGGADAGGQHKVGAKQGLSEGGKGSRGEGVDHQSRSDRASEGGTVCVGRRVASQGAGAQGMLGRGGDDGDTKTRVTVLGEKDRGASRESSTGKDTTQEGVNKRHIPCTKVGSRGSASLGVDREEERPGLPSGRATSKRARLMASGGGNLNQRRQKQVTKD
ncbi:unnamed protein product [Discosporangium mesarthrocarpum]